MMISKMLPVFTLAILLASGIKAFGNAKDTITISTLLNEITSTEEIYTFPNYKTMQTSSYDRRSIAADQPFWFANSDGQGYIRLDTIENRLEKVLFEDNGPGVISRIWMTTSRKNGVLRFYFDGSKTASISVPAYDLSQFPAFLGNQMNLKHTNYQVNGKGGNTLFFPLPYAKSCRITFEEPDKNVKPARYYQVNYRKYNKQVNIKTATIQDIKALYNKIQTVDQNLANPSTSTHGNYNVDKNKLAHNDSAVFVLKSNSSRLIESMFITVSSKKGDFSKMMGNLQLQISFDNQKTVDLPLAYFAGVGHKASSILDSWFLSSNGKGAITCRWPMPFQSIVKIVLINKFDHDVEYAIECYDKPIQWTKNTLYFNANWKANNNLSISKDYDSSNNAHWNFVSIEGRGVLRADLISLFNHAPNWYGEGDEKIWIDDDIFPSHFGTGMEDYYNCSWAPVVPFQTAFGGAPTAENPSSHGFNSYYRSRNLDGIPFDKKLVFDFELLSWTDGVADFTSTVFWYGDKSSRVIIKK